MFLPAHSGMEFLLFNIGQLILISALIRSVSAVTFCPYGSTCTLDCLPPDKVGRINSKKTVWNDRPPYVTDDGEKVIVDRKLDNDIHLNHDFRGNPSLAMKLTSELVFGNSTHIAEWASRQKEVTVDEDDLDVYWQRQNLNKDILADVKYGRRQTEPDIKKSIKFVPFLLWSNGSLTILPTNVYKSDQFRFFHCRNRTDGSIISTHEIERVPGIIRNPEDPSRPRGANSLELHPSESATLSCYIKTWGYDKDFYHILWRKNGQLFVNIKMVEDSGHFTVLPSEFQEVCSPDKSRCVQARVCETSTRETFNRVDSDIIKTELRFSDPRKEDAGNYSCVISYEIDPFRFPDREMVAEEGGVVTFVDTFSREASSVIKTQNPKDFVTDKPGTPVAQHYGNRKCAEKIEMINRAREAAKKLGGTLVVQQFKDDNNEIDFCKRMLGIEVSSETENPFASPTAVPEFESQKSMSYSGSVSLGDDSGSSRGKLVMILLLISIGLVVVALIVLAAFLIVYPNHWPFSRQATSTAARPSTVSAPVKVESSFFLPALRHENELCQDVKQ